MDIQRVWEDHPRGIYAGKLGNWPIPQGTLECAIVLDYGETYEREILATRSYQWHYLLPHSDNVIPFDQTEHPKPLCKHIRHSMGAISFKEGEHETDIIFPPEGYTLIHDFDNEVRERLNQIAGYFESQGIPSIEAYIREGDQFFPIELNPVTPLHPPKEVIVLNRPIAETRATIESYT